MIEQEYGGFDEYIMQSPFIDDHVAILYRKRIREAFELQKQEIRHDMIDTMKIHGREYIEKLKGYEWKMDNLMLKDVDEELKTLNKVNIPQCVGLIN